jgi:hypothetical protein
MNGDADDEWTRTNNHALRGIRVHGLSVQAIEAYASDAPQMEPALKLLKIPVLHKYL